MEKISQKFIVRKLFLMIFFKSEVETKIFIFVGSEG